MRGIFQSPSPDAWFHTASFGLAGDSCQSNSSPFKNRNS